MLCRATANSTVPRLEDRCPPVRETLSTSSSRISRAIWMSCDKSSACKSLGLLMESSNRGMDDLKQLRALAAAEKGRAGAEGRDEQEHAHEQGGRTNRRGARQATKWYLRRKCLS